MFEKKTDNYSDKDFTNFIHNLANGNSDEWKRFVHEFNPLISAVAQRYSIGDKEDTVQEIYESLIKSGFKLIRNFSGNRPAFLVYIMNISRNVARNYSRKTARKKKKEVDFSQYMEESFPDIRKSFEDVIIDKFHLNKVYKEVEGLKLIYREVVVLAMKGYKHVEIAEILNIPVNTSLTRYKRALESLKKKLKSEIKETI